MMGMTAVTFAAVAGYASIVEYLLSLPQTVPRAKVDLTKIPPRSKWATQLTDISDFNAWDQILQPFDNSVPKKELLPVTHTLQNTIVHNVAWLGRVNVLEVLFANPFTKPLFDALDAQLCTPFDSAIIVKGNDECVKWLMAHGVKGSKAPELLMYHPATTHSLTAAAKHIPSRIRLQTMCMCVPDAATVAVERHTWHYYNLGNIVVKIISVHELSLDAKRLASVANEDMSYSDFAAPDFAPIDPLATLWGTYVTYMTREKNFRYFLESAAICAVMKFKWKAFGLQAMVKELIFESCIAIIVTICPFLPWSVSPAASIILGVALLVASILRWVKEIREMTFPDSLTTYFLSGWNFLDLSCYSLVPFLALGKLQAYPESPALSAIVILFAWVKLLQFLSLISLFTSHVRMIGAMIHDITKFLCVVAVFILAYALAFHVMYKHSIETFETLPKSLLACFGILNGEILIDEFREQADGFGVLLWVTYNVIVSLLLLNMLIAMMASTYEKVISDSDGEVIATRSVNILRMERLLSADEKVKMWTKILAMKSNDRWISRLKGSRASLEIEEDEE
eukprot:c328_g1_i2.p1 GENE.c328_g1_i2~~c328_g1_i2.p1  ORF type:complete len:568 (+),score=118.15 c328_g1_i2:90-1793(+)